MKSRNSMPTNEVSCGVSKLDEKRSLTELTGIDITELTDLKPHHVVTIRLTVSTAQQKA